METRAYVVGMMVAWFRDPAIRAPQVLCMYGYSAELKKLESKDDWAGREQETGRPKASKNRKRL